MKPQSGARRITLWKGFLFSVAIAFVSLAVLEGMTRMVLKLRQQQQHTNGEAMAQSRMLPFIGAVSSPSQNLPGCYINDLGLRDREIRPKQNGVIRVFVTGGSVAWGVGARDNENTVSAWLGKKLNERFPEKKWECYNAGMRGFVIIQERLLYENLLIDYAPDMVISLTGINDFAFTTSAEDRSFVGPVYPEISMPIQSPATYAFLRYFPSLQLPYVLRSVISKGLASSGGPTADPVPLRDRILDSADFWEEQAARFGRQLQLFGVTAASRKTLFLAILQPSLPFKEMTESEGLEWNLFVHRQNDIAFITKKWYHFFCAEVTEAFGDPDHLADMHAVFQNEAAPIFLDNCHLVPGGYRLLADEIVSRFAEHFSRLVR